MATGRIGTSSIVGPTGPTGTSDYSASVNAQTGTSYQLVATDNGKVVTLNNAASITVNVPAGLSAGFNCILIQVGAGTATVQAVGGSGVTVTGRSSRVKTAGQGAVATVVCNTSTQCYVAGDTTA